VRGQVSLQVILDNDMAGIVILMTLPTLALKSTPKDRNMYNNLTRIILVTSVAQPQTSSVALVQ
jgi:hypothetical protein